MKFLTSFHNKTWEIKPIYIAIICILVFILSFSYLMSKYSYDDFAYFGGDTWAHQSTGVNLSLGHGYKFGGIEEFQVYKFKRNTYYQTFLTNEELYENFSKHIDYFFDHAPPGYPFFIALIYKIFGIHPICVKIIQTILISICAALLPVIGKYYWGKLGIICGIISSFIFIRYFSQPPNLIMGESLIIFSLFIWVLFLIFFEMKPAKLTATLLGIITGLILLIKPYVFLPVFVLIYLALKFKASATIFKLGAIYITTCVLMIAPWSIYASLIRQEPVVICSGGDDMLLDGNNEDSIHTGTFSPGWRKWNKGSKYYLYNRLQDKNLTALQKVLIFLNQNKRHLPKMFFNKLRASFGEPSVFLCLVSMWLYYFLVIVRRRTTQEERIPIFPLLFFFIIFVNTLIVFGLPRYVSAFIPFFILPAVYFPIYLIKSLIGDKARLKKP